MRLPHRTAIKVFLSRHPKLESVAARALRLLGHRMTPHFMESSQFWLARYRLGGDSGAGSFGGLADFKATLLNEFVRAHGITSVVELGFGDGNQLALFDFPHYTGYDISPDALGRCRVRFACDETKSFHLLNGPPTQADLSLSLDVIYHLVEDDVFEDHMNRLFGSATRFVAIYSSNDERQSTSRHVRHRRFSEWIDSNRPEWTLLEVVANPFPGDGSDGISSFADLYFYASKPR
jgi:hypothetical protein